MIAFVLGVVVLFLAAHDSVINGADLAAFVLLGSGAAWLGYRRGMES